MSAIHDYTLNVPALWEKDWSGAIAEAEGAEKNLLIFQARAANMLQHVNDTRATFERLAWLSLWTKAFALIDGARAALTRNSEYLLELLSRVSFEEMLQVHTIIEPTLRLHGYKSKTAKVTIGKDTQRLSEEEAINRLRAYSAWCLYNDKVYFEEFLHPKTLNGIWDPHPAKEIADDSDTLSKYEAIFGDLDVEIDTRETKKGRLRQQDQEQRNFNRINLWLQHPDIATWVARLTDLSNQTNNRTVSFFSLFDESEASVARRLRGMGIRFAYISYMRGAMFMHGSTLDQLLLVGDSTLTPLFFGTDDGAKDKAKYVGNMCNNIIIILHTLKNDLWPDGVRAG